MTDIIFKAQHTYCHTALALTNVATTAGFVSLLKMNPSVPRAAVNAAAKKYLGETTLAIVCSWAICSAAIWYKSQEPEKKI